MINPAGGYVLKVDGNDVSVHDSYEKAIGASEEFKIKESNLIITFLPGGLVETNHWYFDYAIEQWVDSKNREPDDYSLKRL